MAEDLRAVEYAEIFTRIPRRPVDYRHIPREEFAEAYPDKIEMAEMFEVQRLYLTHRRVDGIESYGLNPAK